MLGFETVKLFSVRARPWPWWREQVARTVCVPYGKKPVVGSWWRFGERHIASTQTLVSGDSAGGSGERHRDQDAGKGRKTLSWCMGSLVNGWLQTSGQRRLGGGWTSGYARYSTVSWSDCAGNHV